MDVNCAVEECGKTAKKAVKYEDGYHLPVCPRHVDEKINEPGGEELKDWPGLTDG